MKVIILAGGLGTRLYEYTSRIPKPMVKIAGYPILIHIMKHYVKHGYKDFIIAAGYKNEIIKKYFKNFKKDGKIFSCKIINKICNVTIADTGQKTLTGGRLKRLKKYFNKDETFMFTYGDGICDVNLKDLLKFHIDNKKLITVTAVRPPARFGEIKIKGKIVSSFREKPQTSEGWINGGFFVTNYNFFNYIKNDNTILEKQPLEKASKNKNLLAYKFKGFWKCMDTLRDKQVLEEIIKKRKKK
ncbi:sugar phosphate nucleotidyltransferase [Pelagibacteraceae bacterium]|jgi:glucose-1-phosphate cytidylyltransferase|nr:sugar phosphate nucleotidyltransferase [Pelagibacteraceae bacterium]